MYKIISILSVFIRLFVLPNPFETLSQYPIIPVFGAPLTLTPWMLNVIAEPILHAVTFAIVRLFYTRGDDGPSTGSLLYLVFYAFHVGLLMGLSALNFAIPALVLFIGGHGAILGLITRLHQM